MSPIKEILILFKCHFCNILDIYFHRYVRQDLCEPLVPHKPELCNATGHQIFVYSIIPRQIAQIFPFFMNNIHLSIQHGKIIKYHCWKEEIVSFNVGYIWLICCIYLWNKKLFEHDLFSPIFTYICELLIMTNAFPCDKHLF